MTNSRKRLIAEIAMVDKQLKNQEITLNEHKEYLLNIIYDQRIVIIAMLMPAFLWGWNQAREKNITLTLKKLIQIGLWTGLGHVRKHVTLKH